MAELRIKNKYIPGLVFWLNSLLLKSSDNETRIKIGNILQIQVDAIEKERINLLKKYAKKDAQGDPEVIITQDARRVYDVLPENTNQLNAEYNSLLENDFVIDLDKKETERNIVKEAKNLICSSEHLFGPTVNDDTEEKKKQKMLIASDYCVWRKAFEKLNI